MDYGMIGKREKAKRYAEEHNRFSLNEFEITFHGDNNDHQVSFKSGEFSCDCEFFLKHYRCAHTMAIEIRFQGMLFQDSELVGELAIVGSVTLAEAAENTSNSVKPPQRQERQKIHPVNTAYTPESLDPDNSAAPESEMERSQGETQEFSIQSDLSTAILQEALS